MSRNIEEKVVFGFSPEGLDGVPLLLIGVPEGAWHYMQDGKTHHLDMTKIGLPVQLILYGGKDHSECMGHIERITKKSGMALLDERNKDFSIKTRVISVKHPDIPEFDKYWTKLPISVRQFWWDKTDYATQPETREVIDFMNDEIAKVKQAEQRR